MDPNLDVKLHDGKESHYYPARNVDAATVRVCSDSGDEHERFLFYRGVGDFQPRVGFVLEGEGIRAVSAGPARKVVVFERQGDRVGHVVADTGGRMPRPPLRGDVDDAEAVLPLQVEPTPREVVRVLVGRTELVTPEQAEEARRIWTTSPDPASAALTERFGRFGDPILQVALRP